MILALNAWTFPKDMPVAEQIRATAAAGFSGIELTIGVDGPLCFSRSTTEDTPVREIARDCGIQVTSLASGTFFQANFASKDAQLRQTAIDRTRWMLDHAVAFAAKSVVVIPAVVGRATDASPQVGYAEAYRWSLEALHQLAPEAESRAVTIAVENVWNRFLLSPMEAADFVDRVNSPCVGWCLDTGNILPFGYPQDWVANLGGRLAHLHVKDYDLSKPGREGFVGLGQGNVDWDAVRDELVDAGYGGPAVYEGAGEPANILERMRRLLL